MTPRSIRRAAERKRNKLALKAEKAASAFTPVDSNPSSADDTGAYIDETLCFANPDSLGLPTVELPAVSEAQLLANRANAQHSSGPISADGKAKSSLNAVKAALTGRTVLLPTDDAAEYQHLIRAFEAELRPVGAQERELAQSIADCFWRLRRIPVLETAVFARGYIEFAGAFNGHHPSLRSGLMEVETFLKYEKQLRNLQLQESRLARRREKEMAELQKLQQERKSREAEALNKAARQYLLARKANKPFVLDANGFEFSTAEIERYIEGRSPAWIAGVQRAEEQNQAIDRAQTRSHAA